MRKLSLCPEVSDAAHGDWIPTILNLTGCHRCGAAENAYRRFRAIDCCASVPVVQRLGLEQEPCAPASAYNASTHTLPILVGLHLKNNATL